mgnify:CR=1 FL=1
MYVTDKQDLLHTCTTFRQAENIATPGNRASHVITGQDATVLRAVLIVNKRKHASDGIYEQRNGIEHVRVFPTSSVLLY